METNNIASLVSSPTAYMETLDADEARWLRDKLDFFWDESSNSDLECVDNYRLCLRGEELHEGAYEDACNGGCCGSVDVDFGPSPAGRFYRYGFNYGH